MAASGSSVKSSADGSLHYLPKPDNAAIALSEKKSYKDIFMENPFVPVGTYVMVKNKSRYNVDLIINMKFALKKNMPDCENIY